MRKSFVFYADWMQSVGPLPKEIRLEIYEAIIRYATKEEISELSPMAFVAFQFIRATIDRDTEKYELKVAANRENGRRGGRPKKEEITQDNPNNPVGILETQGNPNNLDSDSDSDSDISKDISNSIKAEFEVFFTAYHSITKLSKTDKHAAEKYFTRLTKTDRQKALNNIQPYFDSLKDKAFCKKCRTYLSGKSYNDEFNAQSLDSLPGMPAPNFM